MEVADRLARCGIQTQLHIVGCDPPTPLPSYVIKHGFISKSTETGRKLLNSLFEESHFFLLHSRAECYGIVFAEASSFGVPSLAPKIGGIPSLIRDNKNGKLFDFEDPPKQYCDYIKKLFLAKDEYKFLALSAFNEYKERLNWDITGRNIFKVISECCY